MQKLQKFVKCAFPYALAAVIVAIGLSHVVKSVKAEAARASAYKAAASLVEMGEYDAAIEAFTSLGDYKDAQEQIILTQERKYEAINQPIYDNAMLALERGKHQEAYDLFLSLGDYKDAAQILTKFQKRKTRLHHDIYTTGSYSSKWSYEYYTNYTYNRLGSLIKEETVVPKRPDAVKPSVKEYIYDENHRLVQTKVTTYSDSEMQNLVSVITYDLDPNGRTLNRTAITYENGVATETVTNNINTLSPDGCLEKQTVVEQYEEYELTSDYTYDSKGNILTHKRTLRYFDKKKKAETQEYVYTYDLDGNKLTALEKRNGNVYDYEYDAEGNICKGTITYANGKTENPIKYTDSYIYDGKENLKEWTRNYYSYGTKEYTSYTYDADNDLTGYVFYHGSKRSHEAKYTYEMVYTPDAMK